MVLAAQSVDPNWLFSTEAQAAAALVAIIGGFLVSRLVALSVERQGLQRRIDQLRSDRDHLVKNQHVAMERGLGNAKEGYLKEFIPICVVTRCKPDPGAVPEAPERVSQERTEEWQAEAIATVSEAFALVEGAMEPNELNIDREQLISRNPQISDLPRGLVQAVIRQIRKERLKSVADRSARDVVAARVADVYSNSPVIGSLYTDFGESDFTQAHTFDERGRVRSAEIEMVEGHLGQLASPAGVGLGILALGLFSLLGIALPLIIMALRPIPDAAWVRFGTVGAFLVGLAGVLAFIWWQWLLLGKRTAKPNSWWRRAGKSLGIEALLTD
jgi:hypothetical protein